MTKQELLEGKVFVTPSYYGVGDNTFKFEQVEEDNQRFITSETRSNDGNRVIIQRNELNVTKITDNTLSGFTWVFGKLFKIRYNLKDLRLYDDVRKYDDVRV